MNARYLILGDPHVVVDELADCRRLADYTLDILQKNPGTTLVILGDLYNNHAMIRVEAIAFWNDFFEQVERTTGDGVISLVGNHDRPQSGAQGDIHSLMAHKARHNQISVSKPLRRWSQDIGFIPYMPSVEAWIEAFKTLDRPPLVICHQTFAGSQYENGFFAPDGVPTDILGSTKVISGHIHTPQTVGNVWYPGAPRWRSISDANVDRHLHLIEVDTDTPERYRIVESYPTDTVCTPIRLQTVSSMEELAAVAPAPGLRLTVQGDESFVKEAEADLRGRGIKFRSQVIGGQDVRGQVRESDGIQVAFDGYFASFTPPLGTSKEALRGLVSTRLRG